jgi:hypothetical protein
MAKKHDRVLQSHRFGTEVMAFNRDMCNDHLNQLFASELRFAFLVAIAGRKRFNSHKII